MNCFIRIARNLLLVSTSTGLVFISPLLSVIGWIGLLRVFFAKRIFKVEFYLLILFIYVAVSTLYYDPGAFLQFGYYRYDGNIWVSLTPVFLGMMSSTYFSVKSLVSVVVTCTIIYGIVFLIWLFTKGCSLGGLCSFPGLFEARNATGGFLSIMASIAFVLYSRGVKLFSVVFFLTCLFILATLSRGSFLGLIVSLIVYYIFLKRKILLDLMALIIFTIITFSIAIYMYSPLHDYSSDTSVIEDFLDEQLETKSHNVAARAVFFWPKAIDLFVKSPIFGIGFSGYDDFYTQSYIGHTYSSAHAHNTYLHVMAEMGLVGLTLLLLVIFSFRALWLANRHYDSILADAVYFSFLSVVFASFTEHRLFTPASMIVVSSLIGLFLSNLRIKRGISNKMRPSSQS